MSEPIVSVIVPVFNTSKYLDKCLESLVNQTLQDIEIICINDASTDKSLKILRSWEKKDERIKIIDNPKNLQTGLARNNGIKTAVGTYLGFVDSDDYVSKDFYQSLIDASKMSIDVVTSNLYMKFGKSTEVIRQFNSSVDFDDQECIKKSIAAYGCRLWASIFKRTYMIKHQFQFAENVFFEDNPIGQCMFLLANHIAVVDNTSPFYYYRLNPTSIIHGPFSDKKFTDRMKTSMMMIDNFKRYGLSDIYKEEFCYRFYKLFYYNTLSYLFYKKEKYSYRSVKLVYKKYMQTVGAFPDSPYIKDAPKYHIYNLIGRFPFLGKMYLLYGRFPIFRYMKQLFRKICK